MQNRPYAAAHFALELDGRGDIGLFRSIEGGGVKADVMTYQYGSAYDKWRLLGKPKFEDMKVQVGMAMSKPFYEWIEGFFAGKAERKNGAIVAADFDYYERARREFTNAMIREIVFPKLEGKDSSPIFMGLSLAVEGMRFEPGRANRKIAQGAGANRQKDWRGNMFRLSIDGLEQACRNTTKIDSFTIKQNIIEHHTGGFRAPIKVGSQIEFPQISFYVPEADAMPFFTHVHERIHGGKNRKHGSKSTGYIQTYDSAGGRLFTLEFFGAEILAVTPDNADASKTEFKMVKIDMLTESMKFDYAPANGPAPATT